MTVTIYSNGSVRADHSTLHLGWLQNQNGRSVFQVAFPGDGIASADDLAKIMHLHNRRVWGQYPTTALKADIEAALA